MRLFLPNPEMFLNVFEKPDAPKLTLERLGDHFALLPFGDGAPQFFEKIVRHQKIGLLKHGHWNPP
jgi:hypothetical protein